MALTREQLLRFETGQGLSSDADIDAFVRAVGPLQAADTSRLLETLGRSQEGSSLPLRRRVFRTLVERSPSKEQFRPIVAALPLVDHHTQAELGELLPRVSDPAAHEELIKLLDYDDAPLRQVTAHVLSRLLSSSGIQRVGQLLSGTAFRGRAEALDVLLHAPQGRGLPFVVGVLRSGTTGERVAVLERLALVSLEEPARSEMMSAVRQSCRDDNVEVRAAAVMALAGVANEDEYLQLLTPDFANAPLEVQLAFARGLGAFATPRALQLLRSAVATGPTAMRLAAVDAAERIAAPAAVAVLVDALSTSEIRVRNRAVEVLSALSRAGIADLAEVVRWLIAQPAEPLRRIAVHLAGEHKDLDGSLWSHLLTHAQDRDWWVRERLLDVVPQLGSTHIVPAVHQLCQDPSPLARAFGIGLIERLRLPELQPVLLPMLGDPHELVRDRAIEAVAILQDHAAVPRLVELLDQGDDDVTLLCLESLAQLDGRSAIGAIATLLEHADLDIRHAALTCLDVLDDPAEARQVRPLLSSTNPRLRERARSLLSRWEKYGGAEVSLTQQDAMEQLLTWAVGVEADTLILAGGAVPLAKRGNQSARYGDAVLSGELVQQMVLPLLTSFQRERLFEQEDVDFTWVHGDESRFRVAVFGQEKGLTAVFQRSRTQLQPLASLGLPQGLLPLLEQRNGLVLLCGGPRSGKSTALHGVIEHLNVTKTRHIVTLEGAIEVVHQNKRSIITQRELGTHALQLSSALRAALREDPDILVFDDVREEEALRFALSAAETGHLVIATLQTSSCQSAVDRVLDAFPQSQREHACAMLASSLHGVMCLNLLPRLDGRGLVAATELLLNSPAVSNAIRRGKTLQLASILATSVELGMQPMRADVDRLMRSGLIARPEES